MRFRRHQEAAESATTKLLLAFAAALVALLVAVNGLLALAWWATMPLASQLPALFFETNTAVVLLFVLGGSWVETLRLREGGAHVARLAGARPAEAAGGHTAAQRLERRFVNVVHEMALAAGTRAPAAWVVPRDDAINAFAAGWSADDAVIAVTRGALERLTRAELQGVVAHEISHLVHADTRLNMRLIGLVWGLQMLHGFGRTLIGPGERERWRGSALFGLVLMVVGWVGWLAGRMLQASVSRQREFLADASAVKYTRQVDGIGGALRKIAGASPLPRAVVHPDSMAHLWLAATSARPAASWRSWLATHPPLDERLRRLYGRRVEVLAAEVLEVSADEPAAVPTRGRVAGPAAGFASGFAATNPADPPVGAAPPAVPGPANDAAPDSEPESARWDVTQNPQWLAAAEREREALQRIEFWHSAVERHAALLTLLIVDDGDAAPWSAWHDATAGWRSAAAVRTEVQALGPAARLQTFETIARRTAEAGDGRALLRAAFPLAVSDGARLRLWVLRRWLGPLARRRAAQAVALEALAPAAAVAKAWLARITGALPVTGAARPSVRKALRLRHLHPMQRPRVVRQWMQDAASAGRLAEPRAVAALVLACHLLDSPVPPALTQRLAALR